MKLKTKLSALILMFAAVICVLVVGVWAVKSTNFQVGGDISFKATGINATISAGTLSSTGTLTNADAANKMKEIKITTAKTSSQIAEEFKSWEGLALEFNEAGDDVTISFSITNDGTGANDYIEVGVTVSAGSSSNATVSINKSSAFLYPSGQTGNSQQFVITFSVTDKKVDASLTDFVINFDLQIPTVYDADTETDFTFDVSSGSAVLTSYNGSATEVTVPTLVKSSGTTTTAEVSTASTGNLYLTTAIADGSYSTGAFYGVKDTLTSVKLPSTLTSIGDYSFYYCSQLANITIPKGVTSIGERAFDNCNVLIEITIPDSVTSIGHLAFQSCRLLTSITIPASVVSIGDTVFNVCSSLRSIIVIEGNTVYTDGDCNAIIEISSGTLIQGCSGTANIPSTVKSIAEDAFSGSSLTNISIPASVTSIGSMAFYYCTSLTSVVIGSGVTSIGSSVFSHCTSLTSITIDEGNTVYTDGDCNVIIEISSGTLIKGSNGTTSIPSTVTSIGSGAFNDCSSLTSITIPDNVTSLGNSVFDGCTSLTSIVLGSGLTSIGDSSFGICTSLTSITIDEKNTVYTDGDCNAIIEISSGTLIQGCSGTANIPSTVTSIGYAAFNRCTSLTSITIPEGVISIDNRAFSGCTSLTNITIPVSVTSIGKQVFNSTALTDVYYAGTEEQWSSITIGSNNTSLTNAKIHYNSTGA